MSIELPELVPSQHDESAELQTIRCKLQALRTEYSNCERKSIEGLPAIMKITEAIFSGPVTIEFASDPENPADEYVILEVREKRPLEILLQKELQWNKAVAALILHANSQARLDVVPA